MDINKNDLKKKNYWEIKEMQDTLTDELEKKKAVARKDAMDTVISLINEFGITPEDITKASDGKIKFVAKRKPTGKVPPKYRNPETGALWTGRGLAPVWIRDYTKEEREQFLIPTEPSEEEPTADNAADHGAVPEAVSEEPEEVEAAS